jgi:hypothetical protein
LGTLYFEGHSVAAETLRHGDDDEQEYCVGAAPAEEDRHAIVGLTKADRIYGIAGLPGVRAAVRRIVGGVAA